MAGGGEVKRFLSEALNFIDPDPLPQPLDPGARGALPPLPLRRGGADGPVAEVAAGEVLDLFATQDRAADEIKKRPVPPGEKVAAVKAWLKVRVEKVEGQK